MQKTKHDIVIEYIESLEVGEKVSVRQLARQMNISEGTVYRAIKDAENQGLVSSIPKVGTIRIEQEKERSLAHIDALQEAERQEKSYIGRIGKAVEPAIAPLGFDWQIGVSLVSGFAAKEIVVSTMAVLSSSDEDAQTLGERLKEQTYTSGPKAGQKVYTPLVAFTLMIFILLYFPCIATIAAIGRESGSWRWALFTAVYTTCVAWVVSFAVYRIGLLFA